MADDKYADFEGSAAAGRLFPMIVTHAYGHRRRPVSRSDDDERVASIGSLRPARQHISEVSISNARLAYHDAFAR